MTIQSKLAPGVVSEFPKVLHKVVDDIAQMLGLEIRVVREDLDLYGVQETLDACSEGAVCCRSAFIRKTNGVGGLLVPARIADRLNRAALLLAAGNAETAFQFQGPVQESLEKIFNVFVGTWNANVNSDYRLGPKSEDRAVEYYPAGTIWPEAAGVIPFLLRFPVAIDGAETFFGVFLPIQAVHGRDVGQFRPPTEFSRETAPRAAPTLGGTATGVAAAAQPRGPVQPVVFLDYTGASVAWLRAKARDPNLRCVVAEQLDPSLFAEGSPPPAATILMGLDPQVLAQLKNCKIVELRPRESQ
ncbi:MAG: hypothetical protein ACKVX7_12630 [Planctomycetota bacterium]